MHGLRAHCDRPAVDRSVTLSAGLFGGETSTSFTPVQDVPCQQMANYATALQTQVTSVHKHSKAYIDRHKALSSSLTGFGVALSQLSNCEETINASLSKGFSHMGLAVGRLSATCTHARRRLEPARPDRVARGASCAHAPHHGGLTMTA